MTILIFLSLHLFVLPARPEKYLCSSEADCNHNGLCVGGVCVCRSPWIGYGCDVLDLDSSSPAGLGYQWVDPGAGESVSSWGGSVLLDNTTGV